MKYLKELMIVCGILFVLLLSEVVFTLNHVDLTEQYLLGAAKYFNHIKNTKLAFFVLTAGNIQLPDNKEFTKDVSDYLSKFPAKYELHKVLYDLSIIAYKDNLPELTPKLLLQDLRFRPTFSYLRVELANYFLLTGQNDLSHKALMDCIKLPDPRPHCESYLKDFYDNNAPQEVGFLKEGLDEQYNN